MLSDMSVIKAFKAIDEYLRYKITFYRHILDLLIINMARFKKCILVK